MIKGLLDIKPLWIQTDIIISTFLKSMNGELTIIDLLKENTELRWKILELLQKEKEPEKEVSK